MRTWTACLLAALPLGTVPTGAAALSFHGTVRDSSGAPVPQAVVVVTSEADPAPQWSTVTAADGGYQLNLAFTAVLEDMAASPRRFALAQNWPNPFNPSTQLAYRLEEPAVVDLAIFSVLGQRVRLLDRGYRQAGVYQLGWDGCDDGGRPLSAGVYLYRLRAGPQVQVRKMVMVDGGVASDRAGVAQGPFAARVSPATGPRASRLAPELFRLEVSAPGIRPYRQEHVALSDGVGLDLTVARVRNAQVLAALPPPTSAAAVAEVFEAMGVRVSDDPAASAGVAPAHVQVVASLESVGAKLTVGEMAAELAAQGLRFDGAPPAADDLAAILTALVQAAYQVPDSALALLPQYLACYPDGSLPEVPPSITQRTRLSATRAMLVLAAVQAAGQLPATGLQAAAAGKPMQSDTAQILAAWSDMPLASAHLGEDLVRLAGYYGGGIAGLVVGVKAARPVTVTTDGIGVVVAPYTVDGATVGGSDLGRRLVVSLYRWVRGTIGAAVSADEGAGVVLTEAGVTAAGQPIVPVLPPAAPRLEVSVRQLTVTPATSRMPVHLTNSGTGVLTWTVREGEPWLAVSSAQGDTGADGELSGAGDVTLSVVTDTLGLAVGVYEGRVQVESNGGDVDIPVRLTMAGISGGVAGEVRTFSLPNGATMEFVWIEPGTFTMGSPVTEPGRFRDEGPQHEVSLTRGFWLGKCEITQGQWEAVMGTRPWQGQDLVQANPQHPAVHISWDDVQGLIHRLNQAARDSAYRLPSEAEWEYACRAGTSTRWSFGDDESRLRDYAWYEANTWNAGLLYAQPVGTKLPNPWGLYDMHGNVWEWCQDWYGSYARGAVVDPGGPASGSDRVIRGGYFGPYPFRTHSASRSHFSPGYYRDGTLGARLLRTP